MLVKERHASLITEFWTFLCLKKSICIPCSSNFREENRRGKSIMPQTGHYETGYYKYFVNASVKVF